MPSSSGQLGRDQRNDRDLSSRRPLATRARTQHSSVRRPIQKRRPAHGRAAPSQGLTMMIRRERVFARAVCPLCNNIRLVRRRCWLCRGLGYVARQTRNDYKLGRVRP
jgi:hypothetical protein